MVKQEMTRVNIDILGISEVKWTGMGEFNSDTEAEASILWPPDVKSRLIGKDPDTGKD